MFPLTNNSGLWVVSLPYSRQEEEVYSLIKSYQDKDTRICYLLLRTAFFYMYEELKKKNLLMNLHIIDLLGRGETLPANCTGDALPDIFNIPQILTCIDNTIKKSNCNLIIIDTINQLLHYHPRQDIHKLVNCLKTEGNYKDLKKICLFSNKDDLVQEESEELYNDLALFADKVIEKKVD
jgi:hypothetical protein